MVNKRRFPRVSMESEPHRAISDVEVVELTLNQKKIDLGDKPKVRDMSYNSVAFENSGLAAKIADNCEVVLEISGNQKVKMTGVVARVGEILAMEASNIDAKSRFSLEDFLRDKMIGINTYRIDPQFYNKLDGYADWFHGPNDTNLLVWTNSGAFEKAYFEVGEVIVLFKGDKIVSGEAFGGRGPAPQKYSDYFSTMDEAETPDKKTMTKCLNVISQIQDSTGALNEMKPLLRTQLS